MAEQNPGQQGPKKLDKPAVFKSRYPGLQLHLEELEVKQGNNVVKQLRHVTFNPAPISRDDREKHHAGVGFFSTDDPRLAEELRQSRSFKNGTFTEVTSSAK